MGAATAERKHRLAQRQFECTNCHAHEHAHAHAHAWLLLSFQLFTFLN